MLGCLSHWILCCGVGPSTVTRVLRLLSGPCLFCSLGVCLSASLVGRFLANLVGCPGQAIGPILVVDPRSHLPDEVVPSNLSSPAAGNPKCFSDVLQAMFCQSLEPYYASGLLQRTMLIDALSLQKLKASRLQEPKFCVETSPMLHFSSPGVLHNFCRARARGATGPEPLPPGRPERWGTKNKYDEVPPRARGFGPWTYAQAGA